MAFLLKAAIAALTLGAAGATMYPAYANDLSPVPDTTVTKKSGVLRTSVGHYQFTPETCAIFHEDGIDDIEIGGPGMAPDGEKFYFELSSTANEMAVVLGVDGPFTNSDKTLRAGAYISQEFTVTVSDRAISIPSLVLVDNDGQIVDDAASLKINCER